MVVTTNNTPQNVLEGTRTRISVGYGKFKDRRSSGEHQPTVDRFAGREYEFKKRHTFT